MLVEGECGSRWGTGRVNGWNGNNEQNRRTWGRKFRKERMSVIFFKERVGDMDRHPVTDVAETGQNGKRD